MGNVRKFNIWVQQLKKTDSDSAVPIHPSTHRDGERAYFASYPPQNVASYRIIPSAQIHATCTNESKSVGQWLRLASQLSPGLHKLIFCSSAANLIDKRNSCSAFEENHFFNHPDRETWKQTEEGSMHGVRRPPSQAFPPNQAKIKEHQANYRAWGRLPGQA